MPRPPRPPIDPASTAPVGARWAVTVAAAAVALFGTGCGADDPAGGGAATSTTAPEVRDTTTTTPFVQPPPVDGMLATVEVSRLFALDRALSLGLQNVGDQQRQIVQIGVETPLFEVVPLTDRTVLLPAGSREVTMPAPYGPPICDGDPAETFAAVVVFDDGTELRLDAPEKSAGAIGRVHARECAAEAILASVDLRLGDEWTVDGEVATGELLFDQRRAGPPVVVEEVAGSVIFSVTVDTDAPHLAVSDDEPSASVPVVISAERCDPHALAEAKRPFIFLAWLSVDGAEAAAIEFRPSGPSQDAVDALVDTCSG